MVLVMFGFGLIVGFIIGIFYMIVGFIIGVIYMNSNNNNSNLA